jgi:hypothetical protein
MAKTSTTLIALGAISKGQRLTITATSMAGSTATIVLKDDKETYSTLSKNSTGSSYQFLGNGTGVYGGGSNLRLEITINHISYEIVVKPLIDCAKIITSKGNIIGCVYNIAIEDWTDDDYNDYIVTIVAVNKQG